ncbi:DUF1579 family protein [Thermomonas brevis]|uniref:DUF1579 family protein n=1 Tax=Thermomonas brevis TaxID=215691 RepID=A0A7G9QT77_9GAMM|nr:DUF1579 family protein [Thermomonas brevis]QNN46552.1 DUF1579 family protein [Thermomonas brevis]
MRACRLLPLVLLAAGLGVSHARAAEPAADPGLRRLDMLIGHWEVKQTLWTAPGQPPAVDAGRATFAPVLGGRHLRQELHIDAATPFDGLGYLGYDGASGRYESLWMDVNFDGAIVARGGFDAETSSYTFLGRVPDPAHPGGTSPLREVVRLVDTDHFSHEYYERRDGRETLAVRLEYTRKP